VLALVATVTGVVAFALIFAFVVVVEMGEIAFEKKKSYGSPEMY